MTETPEILPLGPDGVLVRFSTALSEPANRAALAFRAGLAARAPAGLVESATSLASAFFRFAPEDLPRAALEDLIREMLGARDWREADLPAGRKRWLLPAAFGGAEGPGLAESADLAGLSETAAVAEICAADLRVLALGFAPGQPYLGFLPEHWNIPRQSDVTPQVPRGAVVVAVRQVIPFANAAPTGWRQVGRTAFRCFDPAVSPEIPLSPGDEIRFRPVPATDLPKLETAPHGGATCAVLS